MDFKFIYGGSNSGVFEINLTGYFPLFIAFASLYIYQKLQHGAFRTLDLFISFENVNIGYTLPPVSCSHSFSSPGPYYICLLIGCISIPAVKFNMSLKPSAKPESFSEEQAIKGMLAWSSCWLIYWLADCGWLLVCLASVLFFWRGIYMPCLSKRSFLEAKWHLVRSCGCFTQYWYIHLAHKQTFKKEDQTPLWRKPGSTVDINEGFPGLSRVREEKFLYWALDTHYRIDYIT